MRPALKLFGLCCVLLATLACLSLMRSEAQSLRSDEHSTLAPLKAQPVDQPAATTLEPQSAAPKATPPSVLNNVDVQPAKSRVDSDGGDGASVSLSALQFPQDPWRAKLYTATYITRLLDHWFIVDCWHHRVVYSRSLDAPIGEWADLDLNAGAQASHKPMRIPHSVATDGEVLVVESSVGGSNGNDHSVLVYRPVQGSADESVGRFAFVHEVTVSDGNAARRPHRVVYDDDTSAFYVYMTSPPMLSKFVRSGEGAGARLQRVFCHKLPFMGGMYARSFVLHEGSMFITAGPGAIWQVNYTAASAQVPVKQIKAYSSKPLGFQKGGMNDLFFHEGWWYATSTKPCGIVRFRNIAALGKHERLADKLGMCKNINRALTRCSTGTPYFFSAAERRIFVPYIFGCSGIKSFRLGSDGGIEDVQEHWGGGWVEKDDDTTVRGPNGSW